jgi:dTDP-4-dehydrorhamnose reductase
MQVNGLGTQHVALACQRLDIPLLYVSTNEVFDGRSVVPYFETDTPNPINPYARSKYAGEYYVRHLLRRFYIVRIAWVFGGTRNFVRTVQRLAGERGSLRVVDDEIGNPTYAADVASAIGRLIREPAYGVYHFVNEGYCSRYDLAVEILRQSDLGHVPVEPIKLKDFRRASTPPAFTALRNFAGAAGLGIELPPWQDALERFLRDDAKPA